jgi:hypothetical protein
VLEVLYNAGYAHPGPTPRKEMWVQGYLYVLEQNWKVFRGVGVV